jgi:hypothetical protein
MVAIGYAEGVSMGGTLPRPPEGSQAPRFIVSALRDPSGRAAPLQRIQIIKGWPGENGEIHFQVYEAAGDADNGASVNEATCEQTGGGQSSLCGVWTDPDFDPEVPAYYYARVLENPTCRWSWRQCLELDEDDRPGGCELENISRTIQEMAWTSPIWYEPSP